MCVRDNDRKLGIFIYVSREKYWNERFKKNVVVINNAVRLAWGIYARFQGRQWGSNRAVT